MPDEDLPQEDQQIDDGGEEQEEVKCEERKEDVQWYFWPSNGFNWTWCNDDYAEDVRANYNGIPASESFGLRRASF